MNSPHLHLLFNHVPTIGLGIGLLFWLAVMTKRYRRLEELVLGWFVIIAIVAILTFLTGEPAEESIEHLPGVVESVIEEHEESAILSLALVEILGLLCLAGFFLYRRNGKIPFWFQIVVLALAMTVQGFLVRTAYLGGRIRHTEIRPDSRISREDDNNHEEP